MRLFLTFFWLTIANNLLAQVTPGFTHQSGRYITHKGARIYYEEAGKKTGTVLLLLHGGAGTIEDFNTILPFLAA